MRKWCSKVIRMRHNARWIRRGRDWNQVDQLRGCFQNLGMKADGRGPSNGRTEGSCYGRGGVGIPGIITERNLIKQFGFYVKEKEERRKEKTTCCNGSNNNNSLPCS